MGWSWAGTPLDTRPPFPAERASWTVQRQDGTWAVNRGWPERPADALVRLSCAALARGWRPGIPGRSGAGAGPALRRPRPRDGDAAPGVDHPV